METRLHYHDEKKKIVWVIIFRILNVMTFYHKMMTEFLRMKIIFLKIMT